MALTRCMSCQVGHEASLDLALRSPEIRGLEWIRFLIHQQRYLELLEAQQPKKALSILRDKLTPLNHGSDSLHELSSLVMCGSPEELRARAKWQGTGPASRRKLLQEIESAVHPSVMVPTRRLPTLLHQAQTLQKQRDPFFNSPSHHHMSLYVDHRSDKSVFPNRISATLRGHDGAQVWDLAWSRDGSKLATAGGKAKATSEQDCYVLVWKAVDLRRVEAGIDSAWEGTHKLGPLSDSVSSVAWSPDDSMILCTHHCDVTIFFLSNGSKKHIPSAHEYAVGTASWLSDGKSFVTGGMDHKIHVRNLDGHVLCSFNTNPFRILALAVAPNGSALVAVGTRPLAKDEPAPTSSAAGAASSPLRNGTYGDSFGDPASEDGETPNVRSTDGALGGGSRVMERRKHEILFLDLQEMATAGTVYMKEEMMSVCISGDSRFALINARPDQAQLWDISSQTLVGRFNGHKSSNLVIKSCFGGVERSFVVSGSEDGQVYVYHRPSGKLLQKLKGHTDAVNSVAWHPTNPRMFASASDDSTVRIWTPDDSDSSSTAFAASAFLEEADLAVTPSSSSREPVGVSSSVSRRRSAWTADGTSRASLLAPPQTYGNGNGHGTTSPSNISAREAIRQLSATLSANTGSVSSFGGSRNEPTPFPWDRSPTDPRGDELELPPPSSGDFVID
ncbi:WD40 repeat-containing protein [Ceraceosorus bombacis]|uniref:WD40 repeat-containing protein n=1 Tax=Ceraceosorus bombacis TaxID=401625 RepID=A0A0P1BHS7_9BASI|nr:WD40 repeat-containing protein [Ceraceosorus bombacis]